MSEQRSPSWRDICLPAWLFAVYVVYPIPHTAALRNLLLALGLACLLVISRPLRGLPATLGRTLAWARPAGLLLAALAVWVLIQSTFLSPFSQRALAALGGQGPIILLVVFAGAAAAHRQPRAILQALTLALAGHIVVLLAYQAYLAASGLPALGLTPFAERDYHSILNGSLLALLLADRLSTMSGKPSPLGLPTGLVWGLLLTSVIADVCLRTRNGTLVTVALVAIAIVWLAFRGERRLRLWLAGGIVVTTLVAVLSIQHDQRWQGLADAVDAGLHSNSLNWLDPAQPRPLTPAGQPVEESAYLRTAWAKQAVEAIERYPLGLGFGHQAFGWAMELKHGVRGMESSHSGWLDFALANGLPGLALWLALSGWLIRAGWRHFRERQDGRGLLLAFTVGAYLLRCLLDGHLSGWRLAMYALLVGALLGALGRRTETA